MTTAPDPGTPLLIPVRAVESTQLSGTDAIDVAWLISEQDRGRDPTAGWRTLAHASIGRGYAEPPRAVATTFVAQWVLQGLACAVLSAGHHQRPLLHGAGPWIVLDAQAGYPREVLVVDEPPEECPGADLRAAYLSRSQEFISGYRPGVPMSSWQRSGLIRDVWLAATSPPGRATVIKRQSCCFIYALQGLRCCAGCPRATSPTLPTSAVGEQGLS